MSVTISPPFIVQPANGIWYRPIAGESNPSLFPWIVAGESRPFFTIEPDRSADPFAVAKAAMNAALRVDGNVYILIPGRRFDASGGRYGRGGGWYDRFLSTAPKAWARVGICEEGGWSPIPFPLKPWDQRVHAVYRVRENDFVTRNTE